MKCCDECKYFKWYYDWCDRWKTTIDERAVNNCFEPKEEEEWKTKQTSNQDKYSKK